MSITCVDNLFPLQQTMMFITITGYFQELNNDEEQPICHFNRTFIIVPEGDGYYIRNEQLHINQPTEAQLKELKQQMQLKTPELSPIKTIPPALSEDIRQQMIAILSQQTNMNPKWSLVKVFTRNVVELR